MKTKFILLIGMIALVGCASVSKWRESDVSAVKKRYSFEFDCPEKDLKVQPLKYIKDDEEGFYEQIGVTGCGKKAVYVDANHKGNWILNSESSSKSNK